MANFNNLLKQITIIEPYTLTAPSVSCTSNTVTILSNSSYSTILYTTDGTEPVLSTANVYTAPFSIHSTVTVKAIAIRPGYRKSNTVSMVCSYEETIDVNTPFYIQNERGSNTTVKIKRNGSGPTPTIWYSTDDMQTWSTQTITGTTAFSFTIPANGRMYIKGTETHGRWASSSTNYINFSSTYPISAGGNIMSLLYGNSFNGQTVFPSQYGTWAFSRLFLNCTALTSVSNLLLPASSLLDYCYGSMFQGCTSITSAPALPATTLAQSCYAHLFEGCTSLVTAPSLPATSLASYCYQGMFNGCTSLTTAPELPASTLQTYCYASMFYGCTSLVTAPVLSALTLTSFCYYEMFYNCSSLNYIKALFTIETGSYYTQNWVKGVSATGTFVKNASASWITTGVNGIPSGWTVVTENVTNS